MGRKDIGRNIRDIRMKMGLTQREFGTRIGKSESQVGAYENGTVNFSVDVLFKIAEAGGVKPEEVLNGISREKPKPKKWDTELRIYNMEDRKQVMTILAVNGYDVGQHKRKTTPTGKSVTYFVHATDTGENADTSK